MQVVDGGHKYIVNCLDNDSAGITQVVQFVKREGDGYPGNIGTYPGTNCQELIRVLIDRLKYLNNQIPDKRNEAAIYHLRETLWSIESRAAERHNLTLGSLEPRGRMIEQLPTCLHCGHIVCATPIWESV